jgi:tetratricopeptide (TPR) repeat protein
MKNRLIGIVVCVVVVLSLLLLRPLLRTADSMARGDNLVAAKDFRGAFYAYGDAIQRNPNNPLPYFRRAVAMHKSGQLNKTIVDLNDAIRLKPDFAAALRLRANAYQQLGLKEKAASDQQRADQLLAPSEIDEIYSIRSLERAER